MDPNHTNLGNILPWDSEFFGFKIGRVTASRLTNESTKVLIEWAQNNSLRCVYFDADPTSAETIEAAHAAGFKFVNLRQNFSKCIHPSQLKTEIKDFRKATQGDLPHFIRIARDAHVETRFFKDLNFPRTRVSDLYETWIYRDFHEHQIFTLASSDKDVPTNYITCHVSPQAETGRIDLLAVDKTAQGKGVARGLLDGAFTWFYSQGVNTVEVATQGSNVSAQRLYQSYCFRTIGTLTQYHRWF